MELQAQQAQATTSSATTPPPRNKDAKSPKLPSFIDEKDELDSYLLLFECYTENASWEKDTWAIKLSALLTGRAMDVYTRMSDADASDYDKLKKALLTRYNYNEDGYRKRFREATPETEETPHQFVIRLENYLAKWLELSGSSPQNFGSILKELWTKEVNIPEVKSSYEYVTELQERLEDSLKLAQEELKKSQKRYKRHYDRKAKPRQLEVGDQVLILLPTVSNKLLMQWKGPYTVESRMGANDYRVKMGSKTKTYHVNMLKKYISREPEENVVPVDDTDGATVAGVIHQDVDPELGEVPDLEGYCQREGVHDVKLGDELPEDQ